MKRSCRSRAVADVDDLARVQAQERTAVVEDLRCRLAHAHGGSGVTEVKEAVELQARPRANSKCRRHSRYDSHERQLAHAHLLRGDRVLHLRLLQPGLQGDIDLVEQLLVPQQATIRGPIACSS